jgi:hypothetical protein
MKRKIIIAVALLATGYVVSTSEDECTDIVYASDVPLWIADHGGQVSYESGNWYDRTGLLIGTSANEDSDICPN